MITDILPPLLVTMALELPVALLWRLRKKDLMLCMLVNLLTNPLVSLIRLFLPPLWLVPVLECAVAAAEWGLYRALGEQISRPLALSVTANLFSFVAGTWVLFIMSIYLGR